MIRTGSPGGRGFFIIAIVLVLAALVFLLITRIEVYEQTVFEEPPAELRSNTFYVLGRWLSENGHPVRFSPRWTGIKNLDPRDGGLLLTASLVDWDREGESLLAWVREGGALVISVDSPWYWNPETPSGDFRNRMILDSFLEALGLRIHKPDTEEGETPAEFGAGDLVPFPDYDPGFSLVLEEGTREFLPDQGGMILRDGWGDICLVRMALGEGRLTVTGSCRFMYNQYLGGDPNARLSWELTGASLGAERPAMLFVRGRRAAGGLWETLRERGNLLPPVVSILVLTLIGFWTVIPGFGLRREPRPPVRGTIGGRFTAEARFFRRHGAYGVYLEAYLRELRRRNGGQNPGRETEEPEAALAAGKPISSRKMAVYLKKLMSALERI
jgi:hypothetical protein